MPRAPFQVLVMPFRRKPDGGFEFAAFFRADDGYWQGIAGGGEEGESPAPAARREAAEEAGLPPSVPLFRLDCVCSVPVCHFAASEHWPDDVHVIPEYAFAVDCTDAVLTLSREHVELVWGAYEEIRQRLHWNSNKIALWELRERLRKGQLQQRRVR